MQRGSKRRPAWIADAAAVVALFASAWLLRLWHLDRPSLWWDEIVQIHSAAGPTFLDVWWTVRDGVPPGLGNAGAVPLDYLLLHAWMRLAPLPDAAAIESYFRTPSLLWSSLAVVALFLWARRFFDRTIGILAALLLATSIPHVLYAVEVRFYSLFTLLAVASLAAFSSLLEERTRGRWVAFTLAGGALFLCGLPGLFLLALQYALLLVVMGRDRRHPGSRRAWLALIGSAAAIAVVVLAYYADTYWGVTFGRRRVLSVLPLTAFAFQSFASESVLLLGCFAISAPLVLLYGGRRGGSRLAVAVYLVGSFLAVPAMILLARQRAYYFHFRHALFLLPHFAVVTAAGLAFALRGFRVSEPAGWSAWWRLAAGIAFIAVVHGPAVQAYLVDPEPFFARTKTLRDLSGLMDRLRARLARLAPGEKYLLIAERRQPGYLANPSLAEYLGWHGLDDRVVLRGTDHPEQTLREVVDRCRRGCDHRDVRFLPIVLRLPTAFGIRAQMRALLRLPDVEKTGPARLGGVGVVYWARDGDAPPARWKGYEVTRMRGLGYYDLRGFSPGAS